MAHWVVVGLHQGWEGMNIFRGAGLLALMVCVLLARGCREMDQVPC